MLVERFHGTRACALDPRTSAGDCLAHGGPLAFWRQNDKFGAKSIVPHSQ